MTLHTVQCLCKLYLCTMCSFFKVAHYPPHVITAAQVVIPKIRILRGQTIGKRRVIMHAIAAASIADNPQRRQPMPQIRWRIRRQQVSRVHFAPPSDTRRTPRTMANTRPGTSAHHLRDASEQSTAAIGSLSCGPRSVLNVTTHRAPSFAVVVIVILSSCPESLQSAGRTVRPFSPSRHERRSMRAPVEPATVNPRSAQEINRQQPRSLPRPCAPPITHRMRPGSHPGRSRLSCAPSLLSSLGTRFRTRQLRAPDRQANAGRWPPADWQTRFWVIFGRF